MPKSYSKEQTLYSLASELNTTTLDESSLINFAEDLVKVLEAEEAECELISKEFFGKTHGFKREFGLALVPFSTIFIDVTEILEGKLSVLFGFNKRSLFKYFNRFNNKKIALHFNEWEQKLTEQFKAGQNSSSERFIWRYSNFIKDLSRLPSDKTQQEERIKLITLLSEAVKPFFNYDNSSWETKAIDTMGQYVATKAELVLPKKEALLYKVRRIKLGSYQNKISNLLDEARVKFQNDLIKSFEGDYFTVCNNMEKLWQNYLLKLRERRHRIIIYLNNLTY